MPFVSLSSLPMSSSAALRLIIMASALRAAQATYPQLISYTPRYQVTDHASEFALAPCSFALIEYYEFIILCLLPADLDLDLAQLHVELGILPSGFAVAKSIYEGGGHSKPYSVCTLVQPPTVGTDLGRWTAVSFTSNHGDSTNSGSLASTGTSSAATAAGTTIYIYYTVSSLQVEPTETACYVGGLEPGETGGQKHDGCIAGSTNGGQSTFTINHGLGPETYTATCINKAWRRLNNIPINAYQAAQGKGDYPSYQQAYTYFGVHGFANEIVIAALDGTAITSFTGAGAALNLDYSSVEDNARKGAAKRGINLIVRMHAVSPHLLTSPPPLLTASSPRLLLLSLPPPLTCVRCGCMSSASLRMRSTTAPPAASTPRRLIGTRCIQASTPRLRFLALSLPSSSLPPLPLLTSTSSSPSSPPLPYFLQGVAFYIGSLGSAGKFFYSEANKRCKNFRTCGPEQNAVSGEAKVNEDLMLKFILGQTKLSAGSCAEAEEVKNSILGLMTIPFVQGTLREAYKVQAY